ncbi:ATP-binding cassette sub- B member 6, mitochondrial [Modicella reniformis]|uniref:ATP-binding cassette sub- B member 6, mitochondrial n=1 Tax=Modicella reniformis TaxID=1440133 RepID=A0A9P6MA47_9FUNG|nr:ATP-binding cassette sub- B member 6, mitochondrial [Modicella reniformis]
MVDVTSWTDSAALELGLATTLFLFAGTIALLRHGPRQISSMMETALGLKDRVKDDDNQTNEKKQQQDLIWTDTALLRLHQALTATFLLDLGLIGCSHFHIFNKALLAFTTTAAITTTTTATTTLLYAKMIGWIASTCNWACFRSEVQRKRSTRHDWIHHSFGWMALVGYTVLATPFFVFVWNLIVSEAVVSKDIEVSNNNTTTTVSPWDFFTSSNNIYEQAQRGMMLIRYSILWIITLLSVLHLAGLLDMDDLNVPPTILQNDATSSGEGKDKEKEEEPTISASTRQQLEALEKDEKAEAEAFKGFWRKIKLAIRLSYPWGEPRLKFLIMVKFTFTALDRVINLLVPLQTERILRKFIAQSTAATTTTTGSDATGDGASMISQFDAWSVVVYILYRYLQRYSSILSIIQRLAWEPVTEFTESSMTLRFFEHVHNLSMQFHMDRKSGELMNIMGRGVNAMQSVADNVLFQLVPTIADVIIAIIYFWVAWGWKYGVIVTVNSTLYLVITVYTSRRRTRMRREWVEVGDNSYGKAMDSLISFETVKYFSAEAFEVSQYRKGLEKSRGKSFKISVTYELLDMFETFAWTLNSLVGCLLCAYEISRGERDVGSFMSYVVYTKQLESPVDSMAWYFKNLRSNFVSMEKILQLLEEEPTVKDIPGAKPVIVTGGEIVFDNVSFQYDENKKGLQNVSFTVPKGKTVAIVGPTGSGKSTILRLAFRFWDPTSGRILIDGQNIAEKTQRSVREHIGVVPQEAVLFNDSIMYNIHYGRVTATKEEIENAAKAAQIHESILKFKDGYETTVGERGTKLSGGEKQRIALARTLLKNPPIVLLDEATSALDSATESQIQSALSKMTENRTTLVVAHRLSTIRNADLILVLKDGVIIEQGTHAGLVQKGLDNEGEGEYYKMWRLQLGESSVASSSTASTAVSDEESGDEKESSEDKSDGETPNEKEAGEEEEKDSPDAKRLES